MDDPALDPVLAAAGELGLPVAIHSADHPTPIRGNWKIDGIALPPAVPATVYHHDAARLLSLERRRRAWHGASQAVSI